MIRILFVCLGNICRSPMAEFIFKNIVKKKGLQDEFYINSAATSNEAVGDGIYYRTREILKEYDIPFTEHISKQMTKEDYKKFDYILAMEQRNVENILKITSEDKDNKIYKLLDFSNNPRDIADPWYYGNFDSAYWDILEGCEEFLEFILRRKNEVK